MYLTYAEYTAAPFNGTLDEAAFTLLEYQAGKIIDLATHERAADEDPVRVAVKYAAYELISLLAAQAEADKAAAGGISSMSNDGVSITYGSSSGASAASSASAMRSAVLKKYLATEVDANGTPLLYAGVEV